jgi:hypothetical protein
MRGDLGTIEKVFGRHLQQNSINLIGLDPAYIEYVELETDEPVVGEPQRVPEFGGYSLFVDYLDELRIYNIPRRLLESDVTKIRGNFFLQTDLGNIKLCLSPQKAFDFDFDLPDDYKTKKVSSVLMVGNELAEDKHFVKGLQRLKKGGIIVADHHMPAIVPLEYLGLESLSLSETPSKEQIVAAVKLEERSDEELLELMELDSLLIETFGLIKRGARWLNIEKQENYLRQFQTYIAIPSPADIDVHEDYKRITDKFFSKEIDLVKIGRIQFLIKKHNVNFDSIENGLKKWFGFTDYIQSEYWNLGYSYNRGFCMDMARDDIRSMMSNWYPDEVEFFEKAAEIGKIAILENKINQPRTFWETLVLIAGVFIDKTYLDKDKIQEFLSAAPLRQKRNARREMIVDEIKRQLAA